MTEISKGHNGNDGRLDGSGFHRSWFPVGLASDLDNGAVIGVDFLGTRIVAYRGAGGRAVVQSAWCPHLGADLSLGQCVDGEIRCAYHHWRFDAADNCVHIPTGDKIPPGARIFSYPTAEAWWLIWAFKRRNTVVRGAPHPGRRTGRPRLRSALARHPPSAATGQHQQRRRFPAPAHIAQSADERTRDDRGARLRDRI
jgi:phenylpropionate dioxygenase-like ring-hydroxylating dioxygenase large terminal subunit